MLFILKQIVCHPKLFLTLFGFFVSSRLEVIELRKKGLLRGLHHASFTFSTKLIQYLTFLVFVLIGGEPLTAEKVFFSITCLHIVIQTIAIFIPEAAAGIGEISVAAKRIQVSH